MSAVHFHLIFNHLPIIGSIIGGLILVYALVNKSEKTMMAAYVVLIISAIGGLISYATGEGAEETVENISGISKAALDQHEDLAFYAMIGVAFVGFGSLLGLVLQYRKSSAARGIAWLVVVLSVAAFSILAGTGYTGGQIRHTELSQSQNNGQIQNEDQHDEDKD